MSNGFNWAENNPKEITATPISLLDSCDMVEWQWGDGTFTNTVGTASATHTYTVTGTYYVCMFVTRVDVNGVECSSEYCTNIMVTLLNTNDNPESKITISPNPTYGIITITLPKGEGYIDHILRVTDTNGKLLEEQKITADTEKIDLSDYASGVYFISFIDKKGVLQATPFRVVKI